MPELTETQKEQISYRDKLTMLTKFSADDAAYNSRNKLSYDQTTDIVRATIGYLIASGLVTVLPFEQWPPVISLTMPDYMK